MSPVRAAPELLPSASAAAGKTAVLPAAATLVGSTADAAPVAGVGDDGAPAVAGAVTGAGALPRTTADRTPVAGTASGLVSALPEATPEIAPEVAPTDSVCSATDPCGVMVDAVLLAAGTPPAAAGAAEGTPAPGPLTGTCGDGLQTGCRCRPRRSRSGGPPAERSRPTALPARQAVGRARGLLPQSRRPRGPLTAPGRPAPGDRGPMSAVSADPRGPRRRARQPARRSLQRPRRHSRRQRPGSAQRPHHSRCPARRCRRRCPRRRRQSAGAQWRQHRGRR